MKGSGYYSDPHPIETMIEHGIDPGAPAERVQYLVVLSDPYTDNEWEEKLLISPDEVEKYLDMYEEQYGYVVEAYDRIEDTGLNAMEDFYSSWHGFMEELAEEDCLMAG